MPGQWREAVRPVGLRRPERVEAEILGGRDLLGHPRRRTGEPVPQHQTQFQLSVGHGWILTRTCYSFLVSMPTDVGIVDLMLGIPTGHEKDWYEFLKPQLREESKDFEFPAQYMFKDVPHWTSRSADPVAATLDLMDRYGIEKAMVGVGLGDRTATAARATWVRSAGTPTASSASLQRRPEPGHGRRARPGEGLRDARHQGGHRVPGRLLPQVPINDKKFYPLYAKCIELDIPICVCTGICGPRVPSACQDTMLIDEVCWYFPELKFVMRHGAEPWADVAAKLMLKWPNLYYSTSAVRARGTTPQAIIDFANTRGADKVMYAGYFPMGLTLDRIFREMPDVPFKDEVWPKFLRENAVRVFKLDGLRCTMQSSRYPFPMPFGWFQVGYAETSRRADQGALLLRPPPRRLARRGRRAPRAGRLLPAPRRPPRPRRHGRGLRDRVPVPRLEVRRRGRQHRHPVQRPDQPQGPASAPTRSLERNGSSSSGTTRDGEPPMWDIAAVPELDSGEFTGPDPHRTTWSTPACRSWPRTRSTPRTSATCTTPRPSPRSSTYDTDGHGGRSCVGPAVPHPAGRGRRPHRHRPPTGPGVGIVRFSGIVDTLLVTASTPDRRTRRTEARFDFYVRNLGDAATNSTVGRAFVAEVDKQFDEDTPIWEHKAHLVRPALADTDGPFMKFRKWYAQFYDGCRCPTTRACSCSRPRLAREDGRDAGQGQRPPRQADPPLRLARRPSPVT